MNENLGVRVLRKIKVIGALDPAEAEDMAVALEKIDAAHQALIVERICQWTLADIPRSVEEAYVLLAAYLAADDFTLPKDANWWLQGMRQAQANANIAPAGPIYSQEL